jgi:hypothetical protein
LDFPLHQIVAHLPALRLLQLVHHLVLELVLHLPALRLLVLLIRLAQAPRPQLNLASLWMN